MEPSQKTEYRYFLQFFLLIIILVTGSEKMNAQAFFLKNDYDTNYVHSALEEFTARMFTSLSYSGFSFQDQNLDKDLIYSIHSKLTVGLGFNYSVVGINLGFSPFSNSIADSKYGKTKSFDFQMNFYGRKMIFDLYLLSHSGFYLSNPESILNGWSDTGTYPLRPDIKMFSTGIVAQYIFNNKRFSMRATYLQNEWQKKVPVHFLLAVSFFIRNSMVVLLLFPVRLIHPISSEVTELTIRHHSIWVSMEDTVILL